jgi:hypothetical protein
LVPVQQVLLPCQQLPHPRLAYVEPYRLQVTLKADELGPAGVAIFFEPIREDESQAVVLGVIEDGLEKSLVVGHRGRLGSEVPGRGRVRAAHAAGRTAAKDDLPGEAAGVTQDDSIVPAGCPAVTAS